MTHSPNAPRVLVVDDASALRNLLCALLRSEGYNVVADLDRGESVLTTIEHLRPNIVCLDHNLPDTDGLTLLGEIHQAHPEVAVVMITGSNRTTLRADAASAGAAGFIHKPFSPGQILQELTHVLHAQRLLTGISLSQALDSPLLEKKALIADDSSVQRRLLRAIMEESGMKVLGEADNGQQAIDLCAQTHPDLLCLDVEMPVMNGMEALRQIHAASPGLPVLMITGNASRATVMEAAKLGARGYIVKPYQPENVVKALETLFSRTAR